MCLGPCALFVGGLSLLPHFWVVLLPAYGCLCREATPMLTLSLLVYIQMAVSSFIPRSLAIIEPIIQLILGCIWLSQPATIIPYPVVWTYHQILLLSSPLWLGAEVWLLHKLSTSISREVVDRIDDHPELAKSLIIGFSAVNYLIIFILSWGYVGYNENYIIMGIITLTVVFHVSMWLSDKGVVCDAAFFSLCVTAILCSLSHVQDIDRSTSQTEDSNRAANHDSSFLKLLIWSLVDRLGNFKEVIDVMLKLVSPWFLPVMFLRVGVILIVIRGLFTWAQTWISEEEEEGESDNDVSDYLGDSEDGNSLWKLVTLSWQSPVLAKFVLVFTYTHFITQQCGQAWTDGWTTWGAWIITERVCQALLLTGLYLRYLMSSEDEDFL